MKLPPVPLIATCCLFLSALATPATAQVVIGNVLDFETDAPVATAEIQLFLEQEPDRPVALAVSDSTGSFTLATATPGRYQLKVERLGYLGVLTPAFNVAPGEPMQVVVRVSPDAIPLAPLEVVARSSINATRLVSAGFYEREKDWGPDGMGLAHFLDPEDLQSLPPSSRLSDLIRGLRGVYVGGAGGRGQRIEMRSTTRVGISRCTPALFLDGQMLRLPPDEPIDKVVSARSISALEIYPAINKPAQFGNLMELPCGAIVIWTGGR